MPRFKLTLERSFRAHVYVEADSEDAACELVDNLDHVDPKRYASIVWSEHREDEIVDSEEVTGRP